MIYLDSAATSMLKPVSVERAVINAMRTMASPGRGGYAPAMLAAETVFNCRNAAAELFNVSESENVVFTLNATHALNIAINSIAHRGCKSVISGFEHNSVTRTLNALTDEIKIAGRKLFNADDTLNDFEKHLKSADVAVCTYVSNVFGYVLPIYEISALCKKYNVPLIVDASQAAGVLPIDFEKLGAAFVAMPGHKSLLGPQGTGILLCSGESRPLLYGGTGSDSVNQSMPDYLPDRLEAGTHNVCGIAGLLEGIKYIREKGENEIYRHEKNLADLFAKQLKDISDYTIYYGGDSQCGALSLVSRKFSSEELAAMLSEREICVRAGMHCAPLAHESAGTIKTGTVRFSFSPFNTEEQIRYCCEILKEFTY